MLRTMFALLACCLAAAFAVGGAGAKERFDLKGEVYPNYKIEFTNAAGKKVTTLKAKTYVIKVEDHATIHDFHLVGPGVNKSTSVSGTGERLWTLRLRPGRYTYFCDPHKSMMRGSFRVVR